MRHRAQILDDGLRATREPVTEARSAHQVELLKLEVLVDIRDILNSKTEQIAAAQSIILDNL